MRLCAVFVLACLCGCAPKNPRAVDPVVSVFGRGGAVAAQSGDYQYAQLKDFGYTQPSNSQICIEPGYAAVGNFAFHGAVGGCITFSAGSGDAKIFLDEDGQLITQATTGIVSSAQTQQMTFQNVETPDFPNTSIPICDLTLTNGTYVIDRCGLASRIRSTVIKSGTGLMIPSNASGKQVLAVDPAQVCLLGGRCEQTGEFDVSNGSIVLPRGEGPPSAGSCNAGRAGAAYADIAVGGRVYVCLRTAESAYTWTASGSGSSSGGGTAPPDPVTVTGKPPIVVKSGNEVSYGFHFRSTITTDKYEITAADCGYALRFSRDTAIAVSLPLLPWPCALMLTSIKTGPVNVEITQTAPDGTGGDFNGDRTFSLGQHHGAIMHVNQSSAFYRGVYTCRAGYCTGNK